MEKIATKDMGKLIPIVTPKLVTISEIAPDIKLEFSAEQYKKLQYGLISKQMEDKWFIYFEEDWLYFHRSWTGYGIYRAQILHEKGDSEDSEYKIKDFYVERDKELYDSDDDEYDLDVLRLLILWGMLKIDIRQEFIDKHGSGERGAIEAWSMFGRLFFPDDEN